MGWIEPIEFNMNYSKAIVEGRGQNRVVELIRRMALCLIAPFALVVFTEAILKNIIIYNLLNGTIAIVNKVHRLFFADPLQPVGTG